LLSGFWLLILKEKKMKHLLTIATLILLFTACNKNRQITITGRLMQSCDVPAANKEALIHIDGGGITAKPIVELPFTTDENGYFEVHHDEAFSKFSVRTSAAHSVLEASIGEDNKALGEVYVNPFPTSFVIKLDVKNPYTEYDTLYMRDYSSSNSLAKKFIAGPFNSGVLDSVVNNFYKSFPVKLSDIDTHGGPRDGVGISIKKSTGDYSNLISEYFYHTPICSGEFAEVTLTIE
jgi:hypothetical protein